MQTRRHSVTRWKPACGLWRSNAVDLRRFYRWVAFERLLARLFAQASPPWVLKGGYALELRFDDRARATLDLDLSVPDPAGWLQEADADARTPWTALCYEHLQQAVAQPLNDGFESQGLRYDRGKSHKACLSQKGTRSQWKWRSTA